MAHSPYKYVSCEHTCECDTWVLSDSKLIWWWWLTLIAGLTEFVVLTVIGAATTLVIAAIVGLAVENAIAGTWLFVWKTSKLF